MLVARSNAEAAAILQWIDVILRALDAQSSASFNAGSQELFLLDTAGRDRQAAGSRTYIHLIDGFRRIFTDCLSLKLKGRHRRMDSATRCAR